MTRLVIVNIELSIAGYSHDDSYRICLPGDVEQGDSVDEVIARLVLSAPEQVKARYNLSMPAEDFFARKVEVVWPSCSEPVQPVTFLAGIEELLAALARVKQRTSECTSADRSEINALRIAQRNLENRISTFGA